MAKKRKPLWPDIAKIFAYISRPPIEKELRNAIRNKKSNTVPKNRG